MRDTNKSSHQEAPQGSLFEVASQKTRASVKAKLNPSATAKKSGKATAKTSAKAKAKTSAKSKSIKKTVYELFDWRSFSQGHVIGVDEVGRGCLAGPVYAAAVILPADFCCDGITDSKLLSESRREEMAALIQANARVGIGRATVVEIDRINILQASFLAMRRAIEALGIETGHVLVDGNMRIPSLEGFEQTPLVKGDLRAHPIGAASIVAKVARDAFMRTLGETYAVYGFEKHKGYSSPIHVEAIQRHGPCVEHRSTFAGVREHWSVELDSQRTRAFL